MPTYLSLALLLFTPNQFDHAGGGSEELGNLGPFEMESYGHNHSAIGGVDINGDGYDDLIIGSPFEARQGHSRRAGAIRTFSGKNGALQHVRHGLRWHERLGLSLAFIDDLDGDGVVDYATLGTTTGASDLINARVFSSAGGHVIHTLRAPGPAIASSLSDAGDVDGDGVHDIVVGVPNWDTVNWTRAGAVFVFSGLTGNLIRQIEGTQDLDLIGHGVASAGDVNQDGHDDILFSAINGARSDVYVHSGANGLLLYHWPGAPDSMLGFSLSSLEDINQDGHPDVLVGSPVRGAAPIFASATVYSGQDGTVVFRWTDDSVGTAFGSAVGSPGDINGDAVPDILISAPGNDIGGLQNAGSVFLFSGIDGHPLYRWDGEVDGQTLGKHVGAAGNINGGNKKDILFTHVRGSAHSDGGPGFVEIHSFSPYIRASRQSISNGQGGNLKVDLDFPLHTANWDFRLVMSAAGNGVTTYGVPIPLALDSFFTATVQGAYPSLYAGDLQGILDADGDAQTVIQLAPGALAGFVDQTIWYAAVAFPSGSNPQISSSAVSLVVLP